MVLLEMTFLKLWRRRPQSAPLFANHDGISGIGWRVFQTYRTYESGRIRGQHVAELGAILGCGIAHAPHFVGVVQDTLANVDDHRVAHSPRAIYSQSAPSLAFCGCLAGTEEKPNSAGDQQNGDQAQNGDLQSAARQDNTCAGWWHGESYLSVSDRLAANRRFLEHLGIILQELFE